VALVGEVTGGDYGRTVKLWVGDGRAEVSTVSHGVQSF
jgi:chemotaxis receptor (MCP) glutamine deamidase CheD